MSSTKQATRIRERRDVKAIPHLQQYAPVWLEREQILEEDDAILFNVVFRHPVYGWVTRRYRYDSFNDVLYYKGQLSLPESAVLTIQETAPYINSAQTNFPNAYGG